MKRRHINIWFILGGLLLWHSAVGFAGTCTVTAGTDSCLPGVTKSGALFCTDINGIPSLSAGKGELRYLLHEAAQGKCNTLNGNPVIWISKKITDSFVGITLKAPLDIAVNNLILTPDQTDTFYSIVFIPDSIFDNSPE